MSANNSISVRNQRTGNQSQTRASDTSAKQRTSVTSHPRRVKAKIDSAGRILVPAAFRRALAVESGDEVNMVLDNGVLEIRSLDDAVREAQALVRHHVPTDTSLVRELIEERGKEAARER